MTVFDFQPTLNAPDDDPYLWLEDVEGEQTIAWAASQARILAQFGGTQFNRDHDALTAIFDRPDKISRVHAARSVPQQFWQDGRKSALTVGPGPPLPPAQILLATTKRAERAHPCHARKMVAKLQAFGYPAYV
ncbi:hypothetical protein X731_30030 [Mesorhizobium sp. L2C054A000]|nr:hypothetical protein X731_30030 [Mesorhizobium sp. L2C054A000]